jgi:hypothetical protein
MIRDHLDPVKLVSLADHPTLRRTWLEFGSTKKNEAAQAAVPLHKTEPSKGHPAFNP